MHQVTTRAMAWSTPSSNGWTSLIIHWPPFFNPRTVAIKVSDIDCEMTGGSQSQKQNPPWFLFSPVIIRSFTTDDFSCFKINHAYECIECFQSVRTCCSIRRCMNVHHSTRSMVAGAWLRGADVAAPKSHPSENLKGTNQFYGEFCGPQKSWTHRFLNAVHCIPF
jgi:hypothetical protein